MGSNGSLPPARASAWDLRAGPHGPGRTPPLQPGSPSGTAGGVPSLQTAPSPAVPPLPPLSRHVTPVDVQLWGTSSVWRTLRLLSGWTPPCPLSPTLVTG